MSTRSTIYYDEDGNRTTHVYTDVMDACPVLYINIEEEWSIATVAVPIEAAKAIAAWTATLGGKETHGR